MSIACKSGIHHWTDPEDAAKCCNGHERRLLFGKGALGSDHFCGQLEGTPYGYSWVKKDMEMKHD